MECYRSSPCGYTIYLASTGDCAGAVVVKSKTTDFMNGPMFGPGYWGRFYLGESPTILPKDATLGPGSCLSPIFVNFLSMVVVIG
jgi:hypothetical protein